MDGSKKVGLQDDLERTFDAVPDLILILDTQHRVVRANKAMADKFGCKAEDLVGRSCYEVVHGTVGPPLVCPHTQLMADGAEHCTEVNDCRLGGQYLVSVSPLYDSQGVLQGSVHVARDISQQKLAQQQARQAVQQRDQFLAMLSHELRNPLGAILNAAHVMKHAQAQSAPFQEALAVIERQAGQMAYLLDDLRDISRVMQGKIEIRCEPVSMVATAREALRVVSPLAQARGHDLVLDAPDAPLLVRGDPARLQQIQVNLLANAVKYTPQGGRIRLALCQEGEQVVVRVEDNGIGIDEGMLESIFDLFFQADATVQRQEGGLGIGLTLVRMLLQMQGGTVRAFSQGRGHGSEFVVRLPALAGAALPADRSAPRPQRPPRSRVLVIEDNPDSRAMLRALLQIEGHEVEVAEDGMAGLEALSQRPFDVALIDIGLPGMDGYEVARQARQRGLRAGRMVALTGFGSSSDRAAALEAGFDEHLVKPCDPADLGRVLRKPR